MSALPKAFCWTRFGPEAGESFSDILARKDGERQAGDGVFYWGIGSAVGRALEALIARVDEPEVLFSPIAGAPRHVDVSPGHVVRWSAGEDLSARPDCGRAYRVALRASLVRPYLLRLSSPELIDRPDGATQQALSFAL